MFQPYSRTAERDERKLGQPDISEMRLSVPSINTDETDLAPASNSNLYLSFSIGRSSIHWEIFWYSGYGYETDISLDRGCFYGRG